MGETVKKEGIFARIAKSARATKSEFKKVIWPSKKQLINNTAIVIVALVVIGLVIFGLDTLFISLSKLVLGK
ncbi:MAG: preprotein translocase subunit SecE [Clostridia bacterium]|nr:preprotein translocase subunit SecE [Clostridia bacterium]